MNDDLRRRADRLEDAVEDDGEFSFSVRWRDSGTGEMVATVVVCDD